MRSVQHPDPSSRTESTITRRRLLQIGAAASVVGLAAGCAEAIQSATAGPTTPASPAPAPDPTSPAPSSRPFQTAGDEAETSPVGPDTFRFMATSDVTGGGYAAIVVEMAPDGGAPFEHTHAAAEAFFVVEGAATVRIDGEEYEASAGDFVHVPPGSLHLVRPLDGPARLLALFVPGGEEAEFRSTP